MMNKKMTSLILGCGMFAASVLSCCMISTVPVKAYGNTHTVKSLRSYVYPQEDVIAFSVEKRNYYQKMTMISYDVFDVEDVLFNKLGDLGEIEKKDNDNDGKIDVVSGKNDRLMWAVYDTNNDGKIDSAFAQEANYSSDIDFGIRWKDCDLNGTIDQIDVCIINKEDLRKHHISSKYTYGDFSDIDFDTGKANYTNKHKIQFAQAMYCPENNSLNEQQFFRDMDGDGYIDWMQIRRFYDTNYDGVKESYKQLDDHDMDGVFEDEFIFDGKILDNSLLY